MKKVLEGYQCISFGHTKSSSFIWLVESRQISISNGRSESKDSRLRFALSFHPLFVGGDPFNVTSMWGLVSHIEKVYGVHCAIGGFVQLLRLWVG